MASRGLLFQLLGPFTVNFDDAGLVGPPDPSGFVTLGDGVTLATLPAGSMVLRVFTIVRTSWTPVGLGRFLQFSTGFPGVTLGESWCDDDNAGSSPPSVGAAIDYLKDPGAVPVFMQEDLPLAVREVEGGSNFPATSGMAEVYVIVATPAAM